MNEVHALSARMMQHELDISEESIVTNGFSEKLGKLLPY